MEKYLNLLRDNREQAVRMANPTSAQVNPIARAIQELFEKTGPVLL